MKKPGTKNNKKGSIRTKNSKKGASGMKNNKKRALEMKNKNEGLEMNKQQKRDVRNEK